MDLDSVPDPTRYLYVGNVDENTTPGNLWKLLLVSNNVEGADDLHMIKNKYQKPSAAIVKFRDAQSASAAVKVLENKKLLINGKEIAVSFFVHRKHIIGGRDSYKDFINSLRHLFAHRKDGIREYILEENKGNPVLGKQQGGTQPERWIHIKLIAKDAETTLVIRDDNLYVKGFTGKDGQWFELCERREHKNEKLPQEYRARKLWGFKYDNLMKLNDIEQVKATLKNTKLGKAFAETAVLRLSRYSPGGVENNKDDIPVRLGLTGLIVMICESARFKPILDHVAGADCWKHGKGLESEVSELKIIWDWKNISAALLAWRRTNGTAAWNGQCGAKTPEQALKDVQLVLNAGTIDLGGRNEAHVEILQVAANFDVGGINVIDEDEQKPQEIYAEEHSSPQVTAKQARRRHAKEEMAPLEVIVPNGISGYAWFGIEVNRSPSLPAGDSIKMRCDCSRDKGVEYQLLTREITLSGAPDNRIKFTYLVMSNAVEATVAIKLLFPEGHYTAHGTVYAYISDFNYPIVLFRSKEPIEFKSSEDPIKFRSLTLPLDRSAAVQVPHGKQLQIDLSKLHIEALLDCSNRKVYPFQSGHGDSRISFDIKDSSAKIIPIDDVSRALEVNVTWKGKQNKRIETDPDVVCEDIADKKFTECIDALRQEIGKDCQDVLEGYSGELLSHHPKGSHPVLTRQPQRWIHVKLQAVMGDGKSAMTGEGSSEVGAATSGPRPHASVTLAIGVDTCYGVGFQNQSGVWYGLDDCFGNEILPAEYNSVPLDWGSVSYRGILGVDDWGQVVKALDSEWPGKEGPGKKGLGRDFAVEAVRVLSRYPDVEEGEKPRVALAGIILVICESAKLNTLHQYFGDTWDNGSTDAGKSSSFSEKGLMNDIRNWGEISNALLYWRDHGYKSDKWRKNLQAVTTPFLESPSAPQDALRIVHLVFNYWPRQIDMDYTINDKEGFTTFIQKLRIMLADHEHREDVLDGHPERNKFSSTGDHPVLPRRRFGEPTRWFHIKLQLPDEKTSTTLVVRDDTLLVHGFMNQNGIWYELVEDVSNCSRMLPPEYKSVGLGWGINYRSILQAHNREEVVETLNSAGLGRDFATKAVRTLSRYQHRDPDVQVPQEGDVIQNPRLALVGLILMVCESARFTTLHTHFADGWDTGTPFSPELMGYIYNWYNISHALLRWKSDGYSKWNPKHKYANKIGIESEKDALDAVRLVRCAVPYIPRRRKGK